MGRVKARTRSNRWVIDELLEKVGGVRAYVMRVCRVWFGLLFWNQLLLRDNFRCQISGGVDFVCVYQGICEQVPGETCEAIEATRIIPFDPNPLCVSKSACRNLNICLLHHRGLRRRPWRHSLGLIFQT
jgi:hypothetical protein